MILVLVPGQDQMGECNLWPEVAGRQFFVYNSSRDFYIVHYKSISGRYRLEFNLNYELLYFR